MDAYILDSGFRKVNIVDDFESIVFADRFYGDGDCVIKTPYSPANLDLLKPDTLVLASDSNEPMIMETQEIEEGLITSSGISLMQWMNNRFIRSSFLSTQDGWFMVAVPVGQSMALAVGYWLVEGSTYLQDDDWFTDEDVTTYYWEDFSMGIVDASRLAIPNLTVASYDTSGGDQDITYRHGPLFDSLKEVGETYGIGQKITLDDVTPSDYALGYRNYKGADRSSDQSTNPLVKFTIDSEGLKNVRGLRSRSAHKNAVWVSAPNAVSSEPEFSGWYTDVEEPKIIAEGGTPEGLYFAGDPSATGFDLRAELISSDVNFDAIQIMPSTSNPQRRANLEAKLAPLAEKFLRQRRYISNIDAQIEGEVGFTYGEDFSLGDIVDIEGFFDNIGKVRVTEWVRTKDSTGEKAFPGVQSLDG